MQLVFILLQKIQKMAKRTFWYRLTRVVPDKVHAEIRKMVVCVCVCVCVCGCNCNVVMISGTFYCMLHIRGPLRWATGDLSRGL